MPNQHVRVGHDQIGGSLAFSALGERAPAAVRVSKRFMSSAGSHAVFLSYASQDAAAARRICDALRASGLEVWFDQSELRGGDVWDHLIRQQIRDCALFIPIISANTAQRPEGYFRLEWTLADQRTQMMARSKTFIVPVGIDATSETHADVPDSFLRVQWTRLPEGATSAAFCARIASLLGVPRVDAASASAAGEESPPPAGQPARRRGVRLAAAALAVLALLGALLAWHAWRTPAPAAATAAPQAEADKSVAVLPFADMSEKHDQEYFSDGLAEELIDVLARVPDLRVPARTSSFSFKGKSATVGEIARALGVSHVLEGSVRKSGEHLRIAAQLVRADNGFHVWSQTYDRDEHDVFAVQDDIAHAVAEQLRLTLLGGGPAPQQATKVEAHNLYLEARDVMDRDTVDDLNHAVALFEQALAIDPQYAPAWAWLAFCHTRRTAQGAESTIVSNQKAVAAAQRAIALDPKLPEPYIVLGIAHLQIDFDWAAGRAALDKVAALDPHNALAEQIRGHLIQATGRMSDALVEFRAAVADDPLNLLHQKYLARALSYAGHPAEAVDVLQRAIALNPQFPGLHYELGRAKLQMGDPAAALTAFSTEPDRAWRSFGLPIGYLANHRVEQAHAALQELAKTQSGAEFQMAEAYCFFNERDKCLEWLEKAHRAPDPGLIYVRRDRLLAPVADDPRFRALLERLRMPPVARDD